MVKRLVSLGAAVCILFSFLCIPASAAELSGTGSLCMAFTRSTPTVDGWTLSSTYDVPYSTSTLSSVGGYEHNTSSAYYRGVGQLSVPLTSVTDKVIVACSYFLYGVDDNNTFYSAGDLTPVTSWTDSNSNTQTGSGSSLSFTVTGNPFGAGNAYSTGVTISGTFEGTEIAPISNLVVSWSPQFCYGRIFKNGTQNVAVTSFRVIGTDASSAVISGLEEIALGVAEMNDTLSAMYADILAVCNSIYSRCGDLLTAQNLCNQYFSAVIPVISSIDKNVGNIYSALNTYFDLALKAINNQTVTLDQSIKDAEKALETYLKPMIDYFNQLEETTGESASTLPGHKNDLDGFASDSNGIDADAVTGLASLLPVFSAFSFVFSVLGIFVGLGIFLLIIRKGLS